MTDPKKISGTGPPVENPYYLDPTARTNAAVLAATEQWRRDLDGTQKLIETRLDAMDKATNVASDGVQHMAATMEHVRDRLRSELSEETDHVKALIEARLDGMDTALKLHAQDH